LSQGDALTKEIADANNGAIRDSFMDYGGPDNVDTGLKRDYPSY
jgi:hypothetical protein